MTARLRLALVRLTVTVLLAALLAGGLSSCSDGDDGHYRLEAVFGKGISLYEGGDVRVLGLPAGEITDVVVEGAHVRVKMKVRDDIPVPAEVNATIVPLSLIGERYVQLFPAWTNGDPQASDGDEIPLSRTSIPVEPDEALAALKEFLDSLDPGSTGRLVRNLADDLDGNGERLNRAIGSLAELATTLADKDQELVSILEHFDDFTATLRTREQQLGEVMDLFAQTASLLAQERRDVDRLVRALGTVSTDGLDLVGEHSARLERDLEVVTRTLKSVSVHIDSVRQLLDAGPILVAGEGYDGKGGLAGAWDKKYHHIDLRNSASPTVSQLFTAIGIPVPAVCLPIDVQCTPNTGGAAATSTSPATAVAPAPIPAAPTAPTAPSVAPGAAATSPAPRSAVTGTTPVDEIVSLLGSPAAAPDEAPRRSTSPRRSRASGFGEFLRRLAEVVG